MVRSGNLLRIVLSKNVMIAKYKMNHRLALNDIAQDLNTFGALLGTELERICIIMTALIKNSCHSEPLYNWCVTAHLGR